MNSDDLNFDLHKNDSNSFERTLGELSNTFSSSQTKRYVWEGGISEASPRTKPSLLEPTRNKILSKMHSLWRLASPYALPYQYSVVAHVLWVLLHVE